jgi:hypothetical protein
MQKINNKKKLVSELGHFTVKSKLNKFKILI